MDEERKRSDPIYAAAYERQLEEIKRQTAEKARYHAKRLKDLARQQNTEKAREQAKKSKFNDFKAGLEARKAANEATHPGASDKTRRRSSASESASPPDPLHGWSMMKHRLEDEPGTVSNRAVKQEPGNRGRSDDHSLFVGDANSPTTATNNVSARTYMTANDLSGTNIRCKEDDYRLTGSRSFRPPPAANEPAARRQSSKDTEHRLTGNGVGSANSSRPNSLSDPVSRSDHRIQRFPVGTLTSHGKRPSDSHSAEDIRPSLSKAHKPNSAASSSITGSGDPDLEITGTGPAKKEPKWYWDLKLQNKRRTGDPTRTNADGSLQRLKDFIGVVIKNHENGHVTTEAQFNDIRERLHTLAFLIVDPQLLRQRRMMHDDGLPRLFGTARQGVTWPFDIKADAKELYNKWFTGEFEVDIYRGITRGLPGKTTSASSSTADRLAPGHEKFKLMDPKQHGNGRLLNGQWWPSQLAALRDGAHGSSQGGITGSTGSGAFSVIMAGGVDPSGQPYPNEDRGDEVLYCGTDNKASTNEPSVETQFMLENVRSRQPVRLIRSHNLSSQYSPELGFRYDGLYTVVSYEEMDPSTVKRRRHRFRLVRCAGQDPIRGQGPGNRPTAQEKEAYEKDKKNRGR